jgi:NAD(P)H-hydrate epimerase
MMNLPEDIYSVAAVREIDRTAIEDGGIPGYTLMSRAGEAAVLAARERFPQATRWEVLCGAGNNAGDAYVVARLAAQEGIVVSVLTLVDPGTLKGDAATAYDDFVAEGGIVTRWEGALDKEAEVLIDGVLGSGLERKVGDDFAAAVEAINKHDAEVVALDIPTGLHGDTGTVLGTAVHADVTVTFVGLKSGLFLGDGPRLCGEIVFAGLGVPEHCRPRSAATYRRIDDRMLGQFLPRRARSAHKGDFGHVLIVGGGPGMPGAVRLAGEAALRSGAGLVSVATHPSHAALIACTRPELMCHPIDDVRDLSELIEKASVVAFGPGLGQSGWARSLFDALKVVERPSVWDADALNLLSGSPSTGDQRVITPHPGEAARLLASSTRSVQGDRRNALGTLQERYGGVAVLKGANTLVSSRGGVPWLCAAGNPGMATAGMGDVLTGIIAALVAQGLPPEMAAAIGVELHARAGDRAAVHGERGLLATELLAELRGIINP